MLRLFLLVLLAGQSTLLRSAEPLLHPSDETFLREQARLIMQSAELRASETSGKWRNTTSYTLHVPGGNMGYPAFWVRDAVMMLGTDLIPSAEIEGWIRLIASTIRQDDWIVRPGVHVPAYAVPDHINFDGKAVYFPGTYDSGTAQGGHPFGKYPPLDDQFYFLIAVHEHWKATRSLALFHSRVKTASGEMPLSGLCERVFEVAPSDPSSALVIAGNIETENAKDFGFADTVFKSGKLLFPSLLKLVAANGLAEMSDAAGQASKAKRYRLVAQQIRRALPLTFLRQAPGQQEAWLHSATEIGNQPDVWGSVFAVWSGALSKPASRKVAAALAAAYRSQTAVKRGFVRHIPSDDKVNNGVWQRSISRPGEYQNGAYWGAPAGWYIAALHTVDPQAARDMASDYIRTLRESLRPDGLTEAWEWFSPETKLRRNPLYVATVALPYISLKQAGLLAPQ